ncbi:MAG: site-2 protease family protein [Gemmatimonadetes bacterium]|nr:MAG: site-2 protease family protein [Gemmatimonadota bacterium]
MSGSEGVKERSDAWMSVCGEYRIGVFRHDQVILAELAEGMEPEHPAVREALAAFDGRVHVDRVGDAYRVALVRPLSPPDRPRWWLHALLFVLTTGTVAMAGALLEGVDPFGAVRGPWGLPLPTRVDVAALVRGLPFALTLVGILLAHELGHYFVARRHGVRVSPPFFLPVPAYLSLVGTLGAFIRIRGPIVRRSVLFDIGIAGPLASFVPSVLALAWGLAHSGVVPGSPLPFTPFLVEFGGEPLHVGTGLVPQAIAYLWFPMDLGRAPLLMHPVAFAGWVGLFVTALNLMPVGQLDGGHVLHALSARVQRWSARAFVVSLLPLGFLWWGWWVWAGAVVVLSRGRLRHPPVADEDVPLDPVRRGLAVLAVLLLFLTFVPVPLRL